VLERCRALDRPAHGKIFFAVRLLTAKGRRTEETDFLVVHVVRTGSHLPLSAVPPEILLLSIPGRSGGLSMHD
jgi:hypothetical protein